MPCHVVRLLWQQVKVTFCAPQTIMMFIPKRSFRPQSRAGNIMIRDGALTSRQLRHDMRTTPEAPTRENHSPISKSKMNKTRRTAARKGENRHE